MDFVSHPTERGSAIVKRPGGHHYLIRKEGPKFALFFARPRSEQWLRLAAYLTPELADKAAEKHESHLVAVVPTESTQGQRMGRAQQVDWELHQRTLEVLSSEESALMWMYHLYQNVRDNNALTIHEKNDNWDWEGRAEDPTPTWDEVQQQFYDEMGHSRLPTDVKERGLVLMRAYFDARHDYHRVNGASAEDVEKGWKARVEQLRPMLHPATAPLPAAAAVVTPVAPKPVALRPTPKPVPVPVVKAPPPAPVMTKPPRLVTTGPLPPRIKLPEPKEGVWTGSESYYPINSWYELRRALNVDIAATWGAEPPRLGDDGRSGAGWERVWRVEVKDGFPRFFAMNDERMVPPKVEPERVAMLWRVGDKRADEIAAAIQRAEAARTAAHHAAMERPWKEKPVVAPRPTPAPTPAARPAPNEPPSRTDPRGPMRRIMVVDASGTRSTVLTLSCGHKAEVNPNFSYRVGDDDRCSKCWAEVFDKPTPKPAPEPKVPAKVAQSVPPAATVSLPEAVRAAEREERAPAAARASTHASTEEMSPAELSDLSLVRWMQMALGPTPAKQWMRVLVERAAERAESDEPTWDVVKEMLDEARDDIDVKVPVAIYNRAQKALRNYYLADAKAQAKMDTAWAAHAAALVKRDKQANAA